MAVLRTPFRVINPETFYINKARRGEFPAQLPIWEVCYLSVATDTGDDEALMNKASTVIYSWLAGGLLPKRMNSTGKPVIYSADLLAAQGLFEGAGLWSEALQRWCGAWGVVAAPEVTMSDTPQAEVLDTKQLKLRLIGTGKVSNSSGKTIQWENLIETTGLIDAARISKPMNGKASIWSVSKFLGWTELNGYEFHHSSVKSGAADVLHTSNNPFGLPKKTG